MKHSSREEAGTGLDVEQPLLPGRTCDGLHSSHSLEPVEVVPAFDPRFAHSASPAVHYLLIKEKGHEV